MFYLRNHWANYLVGIYLLQVNNRNTRPRCEICSKLTIKAPPYFTPCSSVSIVNFEHVNADWVMQLILLGPYVKDLDWNEITIFKIPTKTAGHSTKLTYLQYSHLKALTRRSLI